MTLTLSSFKPGMPDLSFSYTAACPFTIRKSDFLVLLVRVCVMGGIAW